MTPDKETQKKVGAVNRIPGEILRRLATVIQDENIREAEPLAKKAGVRKNYATALIGLLEHLNAKRMGVNEIGLSAFALHNGDAVR